MSTTINENRDLIQKEYSFQISNFEVDGSGRLVITNTGGASASEGGMGSGSDDDREKGSFSKPGEKSGVASTNDDSDTQALLRTELRQHHRSCRGDNSNDGLKRDKKHKYYNSGFFVSEDNKTLLFYCHLPNNITCIISH